MKPIPASADPSDPRWASAFLELAEGLVMAGAKLRIITRFVELPVTQIKKR